MSVNCTLSITTQIMQIRTIDLKGKKYSPVSARVEQFHKDHEKGEIKTEYEFKEGYCIFKATISFDDRNFNGHAFGKVATEKAFEKLESVSVGRALAFAGYLAGGEIASYDEIEKFNATKDITSDEPF